MKRFLIFISILLIPQLMFADLFPDLGGQRVGTAAAQFLKIGVGARAIGMGEAYVAVANDAEALYWNPAGVVLTKQPTLFFSHNEWLVDTRLEYAGLTYNLDNANALGIAITYLYTDEMEETTELQPFGTGRMFSFGDFLIGLTYSRKMTSQFSFGLTAKYMQETIADLNMRALLFDLGTLYNTGWKSLRFAVAMTNFGEDMAPSGTIEYTNLDNEKVTVNSFQSFAPPIMFRIGVAGEVMKTETHQITTSLQLNHPNDNAENINLGLEYWWNDNIAFRGGYKTAQAEENFSLGFGLHFPIHMADFRFDYAFSNFGRLGFVNRFGLQLQF